MSAPFAGWSRMWSGPIRPVLHAVTRASVGLVLATCLGFFLFRILPGDPAVMMTRNRAVTATQLAELRQQLGLDKPVLAQIGTYLQGLLQGDLGNSFEYRRPVLDIIGERIWPTALLVGSSMLVAAALGSWWGVHAGWRAGSWFDRVSTTTALVMWSAPPYWLGMVFLIGIGSGIGPIRWDLPTGGLRSTHVEPGALATISDTARHLLLPGVTLVLAYYTRYLLIARSSTLHERDQDYVVVARATGLRDDQVRRLHVLPNVLPAGVSLFFLNMGSVLSGTVAVETVFSWPGLGHLLFQAAEGADYPLLQGIFLVISVAMVVADAGSNALQTILAPRATCRWREGRR